MAKQLASDLCGIISDQPVENVHPIPIFPWGYVGGAPSGFPRGHWDSTRELQTAILQRLGCWRPKDWERNIRFLYPSNLFSIEHILDNRLSTFKPMFEYNFVAVAPPGVGSIALEHASLLSPSDDKPPEEQNKRELSGYPSPASILRNAANLPQSLPAEKPRSPTPEDGEIRDPSLERQQVSACTQESNPLQLTGSYVEHESQVAVHGGRTSRSPSLSASSERRSTLSVSLERFVNMSARLHCVEDENFDIDTIAWLVMGLGADESRQRLFYFYDHATVDIWYCLGDVLSQPVRRLTELGSSQEACISHGLSCKRAMVIQNEPGSRRLRFESVHRDE
ncbi:hypothetical protein FPCIR_2549 [Fusarium pseudocircinatum]|uniref:Uncharacterized protein n=1 Tax=Fusarium pseudocircinatum TaxID=56676 RepID=A0A8H5PMW2_9HYPO|nr:hypothetical protein FPCIR_2549 [Fusarium pseudocircinatum]